VCAVKSLCPVYFSLLHNWAYFKKNLVLHNKKLSLEGTMASAEREPITGVWGGTPAGSRGRATGQGVRGRSPLKLVTFLY